jgi:Dehydrogenases with different specificities (related to short-chain alcohol dehydrogenases)
MQDQQIAIVTGGGSGIGLAISTAFTKNGIKTIILGRDKKKLDNAKEQLGKNCEAVSFDLTKIAQLPTLVNGIIKEYGRIDILVNNAGINLKKELTEVTDEEFQKILLTNVTAVFSLSREVAKCMLEKKKGCIINISSMASQYGIPKVVGYTASKSAVEGMTRAMAVDLSPFGIRVNCIAPGFIATEMSAKALNNDKERMNKVISRTPMGKLGTPEDIGEVALFISSDKAKYITGIVLPVDGGNSIGF